MARKNMAKGIVLDEFHLTVLVPRDRPELEYQAIRQTLEDRGFQGDLRRAVHNVMREYPSLRNARVRLSR
jgi:hypothetical protein